MNYISVIKVLEQGVVSVRMSRWEPITRLFIKDGAMMCQRGESAPYPYELSWKEIQSKEWQIF